MKHLVLLTCVALVANAFTITFSKTFSTEIKPDTLQTSIHINVKDDSEKEVAEQLARYSSFIERDETIIKKGGSYNIYPEYRYEDNKRYKNNYMGSISYTFSASDPKILNTFLSSLYDIKQSQQTDISTNSISWIISKKQQNGVDDSLRLEAITWANSYANELSTKLSKSCKLKHVNFGTTNHYYPAPVMREMSDKAAIPTPIQDNKPLQISPTFEMECK